MRTYNKIQILGHATRDPEEFGDGKGWCKLGVTTNSGWGDNSKPQHHNITVFDDHKTSFIMQYIKKGSIVFVSGEVQYNKGNDGKWYTAIIVGKFDSAVELCERKGSAPAMADDPIPQSKGDDIDIPF